MKHTFFIILCFVFTSCQTKNEDKLSSKNMISKAPHVIHDTIYIHSRETDDWQQGFELTHDINIDSIWFKPVSYYINDDECSGLAIDFYFGMLRPSDNGVTDELLKLATTDNNKLRPFYRWCLNKTILIQDGALGEHTGVPARKYAENFPKEFFEYIDIDTSGEKYNDWISAISYSGFYKIDDDKKPDEIIKRMSTTMKRNCNSCDAKLIKRIEQFVDDCFGEEG